MTSLPMAVFSFPSSGPRAGPLLFLVCKLLAALALVVAEQAGQVERLAALEQLPLRLRLLAQAEQPDETLGGVVGKDVAALVGGQLLAVQAVVALAADHRGLALEQLHPHQAADEALAAVHELEQV